MDIGTGIAILGPSALSLKLLGPTADYLGTGLASWTEHRVANVREVLGLAETKLDPQELDAPGSVSPRVMMGVFEQASVLEDQLSRDYLGGVLASSRSESGRDDRAATYVDLLSRLSRYQVRLHYCLYRAAQTLASTDPRTDIASVRGRAGFGRLLVPFPRAFSVLELSDLEMDDVSGFLSHALVGLHREGLIGPHWHYSTDAQELAQLSHRTRLPYGGVVFDIAPFGVELFCAAHGFRNDPARMFAAPAQVFTTRMTTQVPALSARRISSFPALPEP